jgi:predicted NBD/HSP70 family sugar kinase
MSATGASVGNRNGPHALCLHIGASSRHAAIVDLAGNVVLRDTMIEPPEERCRRNHEELLGDGLNALTSLIRQAEARGIPEEAIVGGGVIVAGPADTETGYVRVLPSLPALQGTHLVRDLEEGLEASAGRRVRFWLENDAKGAGLAELYLGESRSVRDFVVLLLGAGLGGALIQGGELRHGHTHQAGEVGHMTVQPDGPLCPCGSRGCLETVASGKAILRAVRQSGSSLAGRPDLHYLHVVAAAQAGDQEILGVFQRMGHYLGIGIANLVNILNPCKVILTGQLARAAEFFLPAVKEELNNRVFQGMDCELLVSKLLDDLEVRAALSTFLHYSQQRELQDGTALD